MISQNYYKKPGVRIIRYSLDNVFWNTGNYANKNSRPTHWNMVQQTLGLTEVPWSNSGDNILICLQRDNGWNAKGFDQEAWLKKTIKKISTVVSLCDIFHKTGTLLKPKSDSPDSLHLEVHVSKNHFPEVLLKQACTKLENTLGIKVKLMVYYEPSKQSHFKPIGIM